MHNIWLIIRREYLERVRTKSFIISTILFPAFMIGLMVIPGKMAGTRSGGTRHIAVVCDSPDFAAALKSQLESNSGTKYVVEINTDPSDATRKSLRERVSSGTDLDGFLWLPAAAVATRKVDYIARETSDFIEVSSLQSALKTAYLRQQLMGRGMQADEANSLMENFDLDTVSVKGGQEKKAGGPAQFLTVFVLVMMLYMSTLMYGMSVMRSVLEEKNSRVMEVVLASATPQQLMAGKVLGVGAVGLSQIAIWTVLVTAASSPAILAAVGVKDIATTISPITLPAFALFFLGGYLLYSALFAALGAMVNSEQEAQQWQFFVTLPIVVPIVMMTYVLRQPNAPLSFWMSMVPFFSPIIMYVRVVVQTPHWYEIAGSIAILAATIWGAIWLCARIYRVGILMYGKKPTLPEIVKWVKYA